MRPPESPRADPNASPRTRPAPRQIGALLALALGACAAGLWGLGRLGASPAPDAVDAGARPGQTYWSTGVDVTVHGPDGRPSHRLTAEEVRVEPARIGIFQLNTVPRLVIVDARAEARVGGAGAPGLAAMLRPGDVDLEPPARRRSALAEALLEPIVVAPVELRLRLGADRSLVVTARRAVVRIDGSAVRFDDAVLEERVAGAAGRRVESAMIVWNELRRRFEIPGRYAARSPRGAASGRGIAVELPFEVVSMGVTT